MDNDSSTKVFSELTQTNIKEELYILYLEIKGEINKRCIEIDKSQFDENVSNLTIKTLINYLKEMTYILLNNKFKYNHNIILPKYNEIKDNNIFLSNKSQLENEIKKYQADNRYLIKKLFQYKLQKDIIEIKLNSYLEMEKEYDLLKEKLKYEKGRFLNNDRKDNEIIILRAENSNLKKEIWQNENNSKNYELIIKNEQQKIKQLKNQLNQLNKKLIILETSHISINNNFSTIHNNNSINNGRASSRWSKKKEKDERIPSNNSGAISKGTHSLKKKKKIINTKFSKLEMKNISSLNERTLSKGYNLINNNNNSKKKKNIKGIKTIENNSILNDSYNKILNNLLNFKVNSICKKKSIVTNSYKKNNNSITMCMDYSDKIDENKNYFSNRYTKYKKDSKRQIYNKIIKVIPNTKFPLTNKNINKNLIPSLPQKYIIKKNNSFLNIKRKTKESL